MVLQSLGRGFQQTAIAVSRPPLPLAYIGIEILVDLAFFSCMQTRWDLFLDILPCTVDPTGVHH